MTVIWAGLSVGAVYALVGLAYNLVLTTSGVFNFAQPQFIMLGTFLAYEGLVKLDLPFVVVLIGAMAVGGLVGLVEERLAIRPLQSPGGGYGALVTTVGASVVLLGVALVIWGTNAREVPPSLTDGGAITLLGGRIEKADLIVIGIAVVSALAFHVAHRHSRLGLASRAAIIDPEAARLRGIDVGRVQMLGFVVAGMFAMGIGVIVSSQISANVGLGNTLVILGFVAVAIGGFGSYIGALMGGLLTGLAEQLSLRYVGSSAPMLILFGLLIVVLMIKPTGILGDREVRLL
jgi:branched-chain amino acid transport system permease protein